MQLEFVAKQYKQLNGQGRYVQSLRQSMTDIGVDYVTHYPNVPMYLRTFTKPFRLFGYDLAEFFKSFPISAALRRNSIKHLTTQEMGTLLFFGRSLQNTVITVHDIIPYLSNQSTEQKTYRHGVERLFDKLALLGLKRASAIIAISEHTKQTLIEHLGIPATKIQVVPNGMDHRLFRPVRVTDSFRAKHKLPSTHQYLLFVGPDTPRKNLHRLVDAFAQLKTEMPNLRLIKVGKRAYEQGQTELQRQIDELDLHNEIIFLDQVTDQELVELYALADVYVFPSLYEGFGLPPLEAMACGTPVVCSNSASLPEVVGDAAMMVDPLDTGAMANAIASILKSNTLQDELMHRGLKQAKQFTWKKTAQRTLNVYQTLLN